MRLRSMKKVFKVERLYPNPRACSSLRLVPKLWLGNPPTWKLQLRRTCGYHLILKAHGKLELP
jgi:hypothetical protein